MTTEKKLIGRCAIHEVKPQVCVDYPKADSYLPPECTYTFPGGERQGSCECGVAACCAGPREGGEPGGVPMPLISGGEPCKHLVWEESGEEEEKTASQTPSAVGISDLIGGSGDT